MPVVELEQAPGLRGLYGKAAAAVLPGRGGLRDSVPDTELVLRGVTVDRSRLAEYARVCGFPVSDTLPATYPHVMAFPLALSLMVAPDFPFPAARVVHLANRIEQHRPLDADEALDFAVRVENLLRHPRGRQVDVVAVATVDGAPVWRDVSTYLHKESTGGRRGDGGESGDRGSGGGASGDGGGASEGGRAAEDEKAAPTAVWRVDAGVGPAYAAVSGDRNPIHVSSLAARAFGFKRRIAHGMWTKARCLAQLAPRLPKAYDVDVTFQAPILLPSTVHFSAPTEDGGWRLALRGASNGKPHLSGTVLPRRG